MRNFKLKVYKIVAAALLLLTAFSLMGFSALAAEDEQQNRTWTLTSDLSVLSDGESEYECISAPYGLRENFRNIHTYSNSAKVDGSFSSYTVISAGEGVNLYRIYDYYSCYIYADEKETEKLERFFDGEYSKLRMESQGGTESVIGESLMSEVLSASPEALYSVNELERLERYSIYAYDSTDSVYFHIGNFYVFDHGSVRYLNYSWLDNSNFDSEGELSYRSGDVYLADVTGEALDDFLYSRANLDYPEYMRTYEDDDFDDFDEFDGELVGGKVAKVFFWIGVVIFGFAVPAVAIAIGLILPHTKKLRRKKYWYSISIVGGTWIILSIVFVLLILI